MDEEDIWNDLMNILFTQETDWLLRGPHQQHHLAEMMSMRGHSIRVIDHEFLWKNTGKRELCSKRRVFENVARAYEGKGVGVTVIRPGIIKAPVLDYASLIVTHNQEIKQQVREFRPDVIVGWGILNSYLAAKIANLYGVPFIYYWIDVLHNLIPSKCFHPLGKTIEGRTLRRSDMVVVINHKLLDYVVNIGAPRERTKVLGAGVDIKRFNPLNYEEDRKRIRKRYNIEEHDTVLFFMGWLYKFSGLKEVCRELMSSNNKTIKLMIVGEGDAYGELVKISDDMKEIVLTGKRPYDEIPSLINASDICLLPAYPDEEIMQNIVPIKLYEYMAMGKVVISTRLPGVVKEFGEDNGIVYVHNPEDVIYSANNLVESGRVRELGNKSRSRVQRNDWDRITNEFENIIKEAIKEKQHERLPEEVQR